MAKKKFKHHEEKEPLALTAAFLDDMNSIKDFRSIALTMHLYIEYWINEIISVIVPHPEHILDDAEGVGSFESKRTLLKAVGIIVPNSALDVNVRQIQSIRNYYAHNLIARNDITQPITSRIANMKSTSSRPDAYDNFPSVKKFHVCCAATFIVLRDIRYGLEGRDDPLLQAGITIDNIAIIGRWPRPNKKVPSVPKPTEETK